MRFRGTITGWPLDISGAAGETGWRYCRKCYALAVDDGSLPANSCAAGGVHDFSASGQYVVPRDAEAEAGQRLWFACKKCSVINYVDPARGPGPCSANGNHDHTGEPEFLVAMTPASVPGMAEFRWCSKCQNMVIGDNPAGCKATGGNHVTGGSAHYVVRTDPASLMREHAYIRTCTKCHSLFP